NFGAFS
nr:Chain A, Segment of TAR DNA-binding protein 43 [Homo sapiens]